MLHLGQHAFCFADSNTEQLIIALMQKVRCMQLAERQTTLHNSTIDTDMS